MKFYDTNALLNLGEKAFSEKFCIADITLRELESIKTNRNKDEEVKHKARKVAHLLDEHSDLVEAVCVNKDEYDYPDEGIIKAANSVYQNNINNFSFVTDDICCKLLARNVYNLPVEGTDFKESIYKGYQYIDGNTDQINELMSSEDFISSFVQNEYLIIHNKDDNTNKEMRFFDGEFLPLKLPPSKYIKGKNSLQRCALDLLNNPDITVASIMGGYGSGKTFIAMKMALYHVQEKGNQAHILGVRTPEGEGKEVGYLPGQLENKIDNFFTPLTQQLDGGEFELESLKQRGVLDCNIPFYLKGTTYNDTIMLCDEAEDLTEKEIKLIGTRLGSNSKVYFSGDYKQSVVNSSKENALVRMCNEFKGHDNFGCIYLSEDVRSSTSKMFANLFNGIN
jgi:predicted ribonuclease YlaK